MYPGDFEKLFRKISELFTLELISEKKDLEQNFPKRNPETPIWNTIETLPIEGYFDIGHGRYVPVKKFFKRPVRILFFLFTTEFESRLFRILKWYGKDDSELNEKNINNLIKDLLDSELVNFQKEYSTRTEFKEDLKAVSSFRNVIVHVNKKLENGINNNILKKRKQQLITILSALQQITDEIELKYLKQLNKLSKQELKNILSSAKSLEESLTKIYSLRKIRNLLGKDGILIRTLGENFMNISNYEEKYFDEKRGIHVKTEFAETIKALKSFDIDNSQKNTIKLLLEVGDIIVQKKIIKLFHQKNPYSTEILIKIDQILNFLTIELEKRNLKINLAEKLTEAKYASRAWLKEKGLIVKDKQLEYSLCKKILENSKNPN